MKFECQRDYFAFDIRDDAPVVRLALAAGSRLGWQPTLRVSNGGLDANWLVRHGIPTITFGAGQNNIHTVEEYVDVADYLDGCRFALALATQEDV